MVSHTLWKGPASVSMPWPERYRSPAAVVVLVVADCPIRVRSFSFGVAKSGKWALRCQGRQQSGRTMGAGFTAMRLSPWGSRVNELSPLEPPRPGVWGNSPRAACLGRMPTSSSGMAGKSMVRHGLGVGENLYRSGKPTEISRRIRLRDRLLPPEAGESNRRLYTGRLSEFPGMPPWL